MPSMSSPKVNGLETRYALKHFTSLPEKNSSLQNLDQVPTKLTKLDSGGKLNILYYYYIIL